MARRPLYVRLPEDEAERLDRAAFERKVAKQDLVAELLTHHLDDPRRVTVELPEDGVTVGRHGFWPAEVLTLAGAADLLKVGEDAVAELAAAGEVPGRRIAGEWRFSREALLRWLGLEAPAGA
jgi:excisionase family DNA binding protein